MNLVRKISPKTRDFTNFVSLHGQYAAYLIDDKTIELLDYTNFTNKSLRLDGHYNSIKCLKFSNDNENLLLCSCSIDYVILWNVNKIIESKLAKGKIITKDLKSEPNCVAFNSSDNVLMISYGSIISFFDTQSSANLGQISLKESISNVNYCNFDPDLICFLTGNGSLVLHRYSTNQQEYTIKSSPTTSFINFCTTDSRPLVITSTSNNNINVYELSNDVFLLKTISIERLYFNHILKNTYQASDTDASLLSLSLYLISSENTVIPHSNDTKKLFKEKIEQNIIACATPICILFIDLEAIQITKIIEFKNTKFSITPQLVEFNQIDYYKINFAITTLFQNEIYIFSSKLKEIEKQSSIEVDKEKINLSVLSQEPLEDNSPLKQEVKIASASSKKSIPSYQELMKTNKMTGKVPIAKDKPLTFNSRIRSSGYSQVTQKQKLFQPKTNSSFKSNSLANLSSIDLRPKQQNLSEPKFKQTESNFEFNIPNKLVKRMDITDQSKPVFYLKTSDDGRILASAQADNLIQCFLTSDLDKNSIVFRGHRDYIRHIDISHDSRYLLSTGNDKTCKLWSIKKPHDLLIDLAEYSNDKSGPSIIKTKESTTFKKDVASCNFFYMDKFILMANENKIHLYKYLIDTQKSDIQSYLNNTVCRVIKTIEMSAAQSVVCTSNINSFYSYLVLVGGSDKSIEIFDMNKCQSSLIIEDVHSRPFHQINQNTSEFNQQSYDLFLTTAVGDGIKQWDLRLGGRCIKRFDQHNVRSIQCKISQSPCSNYIFTGSEDRSVYVYDVRSNGVVEKFIGFSDTVMSVSCNSNKSEIYCATIDGKLFSYKFY